MRLTLNRTAVWGALLATAIILVGGSINARNAWQLYDDVEGIARDLDAITCCSQILQSLSEMEGHARDHLLGQAFSIDRYRDSQATLGEALTRLRGDSDPDEAPRLDAIAELIRRRVELLQQKLDRGPRPADDPEAVARIARGNEAMAQVRAAMLPLQEKLRGADRERVQRGRRAFSEALAAALGFGALAVVAVAVLAGVVISQTSAAQTATQALDRLRRRGEALAKVVPQSIWVADPANPRPDPWWFDFTGQPPAETAGDGWLRVVHPDDRQRVVAAWAAAMSERGCFQQEYRVLHYLGEYRMILATAAPVLDAAGAVVEWTGTLEDVHDRRQADRALYEWNSTLERHVAERTRALRDSEMRFRAVFDAQRQFLAILTPDGAMREANLTARQAFGDLTHELTGRPIWQTGIWLHDAIQQARLQAAIRRAATGEPVTFEAHHPVPARGTIWVDVTLTPFRDESGAVSLIIIEGHDVTARRVEADLVAMAEERFRGAFDNAPIGMALRGLGGRWLRVNRAMCDLLGYSEDELLQTDFQSITHPEDVGLDLAQMQDLLHRGAPRYQMEKRYFHKGGSVVLVMLSVSLLRDADGRPLHFIAQIEDITARKRAEQRVRQSLREKEVLLREIHHRVKNNLQIVSTLLDLQSDHSRDPHTVQLFHDSRGRVRSMALIHERLYRSENLAQVPFDEYVRCLGEDLCRSYKVPADEVSLEVEIQVVALPIDLAIPCGLILNELISNSLKHAFPEGQGGAIRVAMSRDAGGGVCLRVRDDGAGIPEWIDFRQTESFGMQLVTTLVEQLSGTIEQEPGPGASFRIEFPFATTPLSE